MDIDPVIATAAPAVYPRLLHQPIPVQNVSAVPTIASAVTAHAAAAVQRANAAAVIGCARSFAAPLQCQACMIASTTVLVLADVCLE